jgi:hypothetical protein
MIRNALATGDISLFRVVSVLKDVVNRPTRATTSVSSSMSFDRSAPPPGCCCVRPLPSSFSAIRRATRHLTMVTSATLACRDASSSAPRSAAIESRSIAPPATTWQQLTKSLSQFEGPLFIGGLRTSVQPFGLPRPHSHKTRRIHSRLTWFGRGRRGLFVDDLTRNRVVVCYADIRLRNVRSDPREDSIACFVARHSTSLIRCPADLIVAHILFASFFTTTSHK